MGLFWRRKGGDEFVSLRLNEPAPAKDKETQPAPPTPEPTVAAPPTETVKQEPVRSPSPFTSSVLGLNLSIEELFTNMVKYGGGDDKVFVALDVLGDDLGDVFVPA